MLLLGLAYKENVDDMRESPTFHIMDQLRELGAEVSYFDPHIPIITPTREHADWAGLESVTWDETLISQFDCVIICTDHQCFNYQQLVDWADVVLDTRNALSKAGVTPKENQLFQS